MLYHFHSRVPIVCQKSTGIIPEDYHKDLRPILDNKPVKVSFSMKLNSISEVNMETMVRMLIKCSTYVSVQQNPTVHEKISQLI